MIKSTNFSNSDSSENSLDSDFNYEATVAKVEAIIDKIERGQLDLAAVFDEFAAAVEYLRNCESFLQERQQQMDLVVETLEGNTESF